jgi:hypothetical protein
MDKVIMVITITCLARTQSSKRLVEGHSLELCRSFGGRRRTLTIHMSISPRGKKQDNTSRANLVYELIEIHSYPFILHHVLLTCITVTLRLLSICIMYY